MITHYTTVADCSPIPVILYRYFQIIIFFSFIDSNGNVSSVPGNTGIDLSIDAIKVLATHPNIIGMKDSGGDVTRIGSIVQKTRGQDFKVLSGSASFLLPSYLAGAVGGVCALANVLGEVICHMHSLYHENTIDKELQRRLIDPNTMVITSFISFILNNLQFKLKIKSLTDFIHFKVTRRFGVPGMKAALDLFGYFGGPNRSPMLSVSAEARQVIKKAFVDNEFVPEAR